jgi:putative membrane protein
MKRATDFLDEAGRTEVEAAILEAEKLSSVEIACVVATESGRYDRAEGLVGILFGLVGLGLADNLWLGRSGVGSWQGASPMAVLALGIVLGYAFGNVLASILHPVRRLLVPRQEMDEEVTRGAAAAFTRLRVGTTAAGTGLLVYVSLFERQVVILLDQAVRQAAGQELADKLCAKAVEGLKAGGGAEVLAELVQEASRTLAKSLPPTEYDQDELSNRVLVLHPR